MIRQSQKQEGQFASFEDTAAHLPEPFVAEAPGRWHGNRTGPVGAQTEKFHLHAVRRLYLAVVNRAILDRKSTRLNSSHLGISYAVFCLKKKNKTINTRKSSHCN